MLFCPKCGSLMRPKMEKGKKVVACGCGYKCIAESVTITECSKCNQKDVVVVENEISANPIVDAECAKCGPTKAEAWEVQTRAADEPATRFFRCVKCKHTWREYK